MKPLVNRIDALRNISRSFVSVVKVNASSLKSIRVKSKDFFTDNDDHKVKLICFDKSGNEVNPEELKTLQIQSSRDSFQLKCGDLGDISIQLEIPMDSSPDADIAVNARKLSNVEIENLQTKSIKVDLNHGNIALKNLKSDFIDVETENGNISTKSMLLGKIIDFEAKNGVSDDRTEAF